MTDLKWWGTAVFYQVYPRNFADSNGNGIVDLEGIIDRFDADTERDAFHLQR